MLQVGNILAMSSANNILISGNSLVVTNKGTYKLDIHVGLKDIGESAYTVHRREPSSITVSIYSGINNELNPEGAGTTSPSSSSNNS